MVVETTGNPTQASRILTRMPPPACRNDKGRRFGQEGKDR
jgi:hypothetical protein